ncbi:MAG: peptidoglycan-binding protein [Lysobacteraceae bacterium]|nr:MAG: peptidoglycan-binding protein [Xanthomonadaceae bacterium]
MPNYRIIESVGRGTEDVNNWGDIEHHHPSQALREPGRVYARINGRAEEVASDYNGTAIYTPGGQLMVSKDFILQDSQTGSANVPVPSPANGYIGEVDRRNGFVTILDRPGGEVMFRLRHMDVGQDIQPGAQVQYGQPLGTQSGYGRGDPNYYGTHVHIDANVRYLDQADRYVRDMATGVITTDRRPENVANVTNPVPPTEQISGNFPPPPPQALADGVIRQGERGPDVALLQEALRRADARDNQGREVVQDGDFGGRTREAVQNYQRAYNQQHPDNPLPTDGVAEQRTLAALGVVQQQDRARNDPAAPADPLPQQRQGANGAVPIDQPGNPAYALYGQAYRELGDLPAGTFGNDQERVNAAATLAAGAYRQGMDRIADVVQNDQGRLFALDRQADDPSARVAWANLQDARGQSVQQSTDQVGQHQRAQEAQPRVEQAPGLQSPEVNQPEVAAPRR